MRAVAEGVGSRAIASHKALAIDHPAVAIGVIKIRMIGDAAIDHSHADSSAIERKLRSRIVRFNCRGELFVSRVGQAYRAVRRDIGDVWISRQLGQLICR